MNRQNHSWKKMAEAFGRAVHNRDRLITHAPQTNKGYSKAARADEIEDRRWERIADKAGVGEEFRRGFNDEELLPDDGSLIWDDGAAKPVTAKEFNSAQRNQIELDNAITAALDKRFGTDERAKAEARRNVIDDLKNGYEVGTILDRLDPSRWADGFREATDTFEIHLWNVIDELKTQGRSVDDILGALKSMGVN